MLGLHVAANEEGRPTGRTREAAVHIFVITSPPGGVHIFAWPANFRNFAPKPCIFSHTNPVRARRTGTVRQQSAMLLFCAVAMALNDVPEGGTTTVEHRRHM